MYVCDFFWLYPLVDGLLIGIQIFVSANHGDEDETRIDSIDVFGLPVE